MPSPATVVLTAAGTELALTWTGDRPPEVTHWGRALGAGAHELAASAAPAVMHSSFDEPRHVSVLPSQHEGWSGTPAIEFVRQSGGVPVRLAVEDVRAERDAAVLTLTDAGNGVGVDLTYRFDRFGVLRASALLTNTGATPLAVEAVRLMLPLPARAAEVLDLTGRWSAERRPQRSVLTDGTRKRAARRGRTGHDSPLLQMAGTPGFGFRTGEVWGCHVAWSGDSEYAVERLSEGAGVHAALLSGAELLTGGEIVLPPGGGYRTPEVVFVWSDAGVDGLSARLHPSVRAGAAYPAGPRPLVLNTWEAVYFAHRLEPLVELARTAARVGVERFVLDDGWFTARRDDTTGLGDWHVDAAVWPEGLQPLADAVRDLGMQFGLWFEPEMVNPGSAVAREHPEWILAPAEPGPSWRFQYALNVAHPDAYAYLLERMDALVSEVGVDFIKWDHNRDLHEPLDRRTGVSGVHAQTLGTYALMDELRARHPGLEIESCASGGGRVDLGVLAHTQRIWASDTNDAIERQHIQRWTGVLVPPELVGSHVGPERAHTTGRVLDLPFRLVTALFGHAGIEWDITHCTDDELAAVAAWAALYKRWRPVLATGRTVRADDVRPGSLLHGVVAEDRGTGLFAWAQVEAGWSATSERVPLPGLDPARSYRVTVREDLGPARRRSLRDPAWVAAPPAAWSGALLTDAGLPLPVLSPGQALLLEVEAVG